MKTKELIEELEKYALEVSEDVIGFYDEDWDDFKEKIEEQEKLKQNN